MFDENTRLDFLQTSQHSNSLGIRVMNFDLTLVLIQSERENKGEELLSVCQPE